MNISILILTLFFNSSAFGDNLYRVIDQKISDINNQTLYKAYCLFAGIDGPSEFVLVSRMDSAAESGYYTPSYQTVYFDKEGRIRKTIDFSEYISSVNRISYYDESGALIYSISYDIGEGIVAYSSNTYFNEGKIILKTGKIQIDCVERSCYFRFEKGELHTTETECIPQDYLSDAILHDESINHVSKIEQWRPHQMNITKDCIKVRFEEACVGDTTIVNAYDVNIRKGPGLKEPIIDTFFHQGCTVVIMEKQFKEKDASLNEYHWCKIKYNIKDLETPDKIGYIYGKYLDLVERKVE